MGRRVRGSSFHLAMEMLLSQTRTEMLHVPYRGGAPATQALVAGEVQVCALDAVSGLPFVRAGSARILAVTGSARTPLLPDVPTVAEAMNLQGFRTTTDFAIVRAGGHAGGCAAPHPPGEPGRAALARGEQPDCRAGHGGGGGHAGGFPAYFRRELEMWGAIIREKGIRAS